MDISMKYAFLTLGQYIHEFFELPGNYEFDAGTEVITYEKRNLRMDIAYFSNRHIINNIENQSKAVTYEKLNTIAEYAKFILIYNNALVNTIIISKVDPKYCLKEINLTKSLILRPHYIYMSPEKIMKLLNRIKKKVNNNKRLTHHEAIALALIPTLSQDHIAEKVTIDVCELIKKYTFKDKKLKNHICFIVGIMIDRNIDDIKKQRELKEAISMTVNKKLIRRLVEEENKDILKEKDRIIAEKDQEIEEKDQEIEEKDKKLKDLDKKLKEAEKITKNIITNENIDDAAKVSILSSVLFIN